MFAVNVMASKHREHTDWKQQWRGGTTFKKANNWVRQRSHSSGARGELNRTSKDCHIHGFKKGCGYSHRSRNSCPPELATMGNECSRTGPGEGASRSPAVPDVLESIYALVSMDLLTQPWTTRYRCFFLAHQRPIGQ